MDPASSEAPFRERVGEVTDTDLFTRLPQVLLRHGYQIELQEQRWKDFHFTTQWRGVDPRSDEEVNSVEPVQIRLHLRAVWNGRLYILHVEAESRVRRGEDRWSPWAPSTSARRALHELAEDVRAELASGLRRY